MCTAVYRLFRGREFNAAELSFSPHSHSIRLSFCPLEGDGGWWQADTGTIANLHLSTSSRFHVHTCEMRHYIAYAFCPVFRSFVVWRSQSHKICKMQKSSTRKPYYSSHKKIILVIRLHASVHTIANERTNERCRVDVYGGVPVCINLQSACSYSELENASSASA